MRNLYFNALFWILWLGASAQNHAPCKDLADSIEALTPAFNGGDYNDYALECSLKNGLPVGYDPNHPPYETLKESVKSFDKMHYHEKGGSDYGLWDYSVVIRGEHYAALTANRAVNRIVQHAYCFELKED
jgi:hypothetical protein